MRKKARTIGIDELRATHADRSREIRARLAEFAAVPAGEYFYELLYCLLTPQSSAVNAGRVVETLRERGFEHERDRSQRWSDTGKAAADVESWYYENLMIFRRPPDR